MRKFTLFSLLVIFISISIQAQQINNFDNLNEYKEFKQHINAGSNLEVALSAFNYTSSDFAEKKNGYIDQQVLDDFGSQTYFTTSEIFLKNLSENNTLLDSIITYHFISPSDSILESKTIYTRNADGYQTLLLTYIWIPETNTWIYNAKSEYSYDENNNLILVITYEWNSDLNDWEGTYKNEFAFDNNGNTLLSARYQWDTNLNQWVGYSIKFEYAFYESGLLQFRAYYSWDTEINDWHGINKSEFFYDNNDYLITVIGYSFEEDWEYSSKNEYTNHENGQPETILKHFWNGYDWGIDAKDEYSYNTDFQLILVMGYHWYSNTWHESIKIVHDYDENGNKNLYAFYYWSDYQWKGQIKNTSLYDESGNIINRIRYEWDELTNDWVPDIEYDITYNEHGNMLSFFYYYNWDKEQNEWINKLKEYYTYNMDNQIKVFEYYEWDEGSDVWVGNVKEISNYDDEGNLAAFATYNWDSEISDWVLNFKDFYYYSDFYVANEEHANIELAVYPNPVSTSASFTFYLQEPVFVELCIYNHLGKLIHQSSSDQSAGRQDLMWKAGSLASGMYYYQLRMGNQNLSGKLLKIR